MAIATATFLEAMDCVGCKLCVLFHTFNGSLSMLLYWRLLLLVWLNPLLGRDGFAPTARGMQAALPFLDLFAPAHNLDSLAALEPYLARL